jgi:hypothetical protein
MNFPSPPFRMIGNANLLALICCFKALARFGISVKRLEILGCFVTPRLF